MTQSLDPIVVPPAFPDHTQLPESDGTFVKNFQEHPQSILLTDSIGPVLQQRHPDGQYAIGQDCGIYWRETDPPERGAEAPDWFYVPNVPPLLLDGGHPSFLRGVARIYCAFNCDRICQWRWNRRTRLYSLISLRRRTSQTGKILGIRANSTHSLLCNFHRRTQRIRSLSVITRFILFNLLMRVIERLLDRITQYINFFMVI